MTAHPDLDDLAGQVAVLRSQVDELTQRLDGQAPALATPPPAQLRFPDVQAWVNGMFLPMFGWRVDGQRWHWCGQWWRHAEAIWRLELLWRLWEAYRLAATGMSAWSAELDRHLRELLGPDGPFRQCRIAQDDRPARHTDPPTATAEPAPDGWWT
jgi:hypothetical protein